MAILGHFGSILGLHVVNQISHGPPASLQGSDVWAPLCRWLFMVFYWACKDSELGAHSRGIIGSTLGRVHSPTIGPSMGPESGTLIYRLLRTPQQQGKRG